MTPDLLMDCFRTRLAALAGERGLEPEETERILAAFRHAMANRFCDENQIHTRLTRNEDA